jgi:hypothetical protein
MSKTLFSFSNSRKEDLFLRARSDVLHTGEAPSSIG